MKKLLKVKPKKRIPTLVYVDCPSCHKPRLLKEKFEDGTVASVSQETEQAVDGTERHVDMCIHCINKFEKRDDAYMRRQAKEMLKAMKAAQAESADQSDIEL